MALAPEISNSKLGSDALRYTIWGSVLSPFSLKVRAMCDFARVDYAWLPGDGGLVDGFRFNWRVERLKAGRLALTYPPLDELSEFPLVPFLFADDGSNIYDSTAIARWLDDHHATETRRLIPNDPACRFITRLIDDHFDEFGLYVAHHHRWVTSAQDNDAGLRLANEFAQPLPGVGQRRLGHWFAKRQVRRLPYLFSLAPPGYHVDGLPPSLTPPSRADFPGTHALLDEAFVRSIDLVEDVLQQRPFLFGSRFTLADASVYGQLGMNTSDPSAAHIIEKRGPMLWDWLQTIHRQGARGFADGEAPTRDAIEALTPLLEEIVRIHVPLMEQNERAYEHYKAKGQTRFNESAFWRGESLYDGELLGRPFRSVVKTFQVKVWRDLKAHYAELETAHRSALPPSVRAAFDPGPSRHRAKRPTTPDRPCRTMSSPRIAIIGGGIAGCSATWFLRQALGEGADLTVYERGAQLGGRLATLDVGGTPVESGGTIIHETNRYLASFVDHLGLERVEPHQREEGGTDSVGVWDGRRFAFRTHDSALITRLAAVLSFGVMGPLRLQRAVAQGVEKWNQVYEHLEQGTAFDSPLALCSELGLADLLDQDGRRWLADSGVRGRFVDQYATPVGRIMYGQDVSMNGLATSIALAGAGLAGSLFAVGGGNRLVCEGLVRDAGATLQTGTECAGVSREGARFTVQLSDGQSVLHDVVVLATPAGPAALALSGVEPPESALRPRPFQITWATFVKGTPRADYFGMVRPSDLPETVLTVEDDAIPFSSLGLVATSPDGASVYKLFSRDRVGESLLDQLFSRRDAVEQVRWEAYPVLRPNSDLPLPPFRLADGLYWVNAMEFAVSTMETEAVAARNVANLVAAQLLGR